jgi:hypothetical protein
MIWKSHMLHILQTTLTASIAGVEAMHWSVLLGALGKNPAPVSFIPAPDLQVGELALKTETGT